MAKELSTVTDLDFAAKNWSIASRHQSHGLYALALVSAREWRPGSQSAGPLVGPAGIGAYSKSDDHPHGGEFIFNVNPKSMDLEEPASVQITPTQDGSHFVEHQGGIYKNITLQGTTGLRPDQTGEVPVIPFLGIPNPFAQPTINPKTNLPIGEKSGFQYLLELRNLFRQYYDIKRDPRFANEFYMVWQNGKEGEYWVVEPLTFRTRRSAQSPLTAEYEIQLKTVQKFDLRVFQFGSKDPRRERTSLQKFNDFMRRTNRALANSLRKVEGLIDSTVLVAQSTIDSVIAPARTLLNGLTNITTAASRALDMPRNSIGQLAGAANNLVDALYQTMNNVNAYRTQGILTPLTEAISACKEIGRVATRVYSQDTLFSTTTSAQLDKRKQAYRNAFTGAPLTGGSLTDVNNLSMDTGTQTAPVGNLDTIFSLSQRLLGDSARWKELVILNDLKAPYVDPTGDGTNILRPGDTILIPAVTNALVSGVSPDLSTATRDPIVERLGRDIKLDAYESAGGLVELDLSVSSKGDLGSIEGIENLAQAVEVKFSTEQGSLPTHPGYGVLFPIGQKATIRSMVQFNLNLRASLLADSRIDNVNNLRFSAQGNTVSVRAELQVVEVDESVSVSFDARR